MSAAVLVTSTASNPLSGIITGTCASPTTTISTYAYDAQGRRKSKVVGSANTVFVTDADNREVLEYSGSTGAVQAWYAYGTGSNEVLNRMNVTASTRQTLIPDSHGSIAATLDSSSAAVTKIGYQTYGEHPSLASGSFNYTAQRLDAETSGSTAEPSGLYYYRARMYSPTLGRFLQVDPIGYDGGANLYAYVGNDPLNNSDPSGLINNCYNTGACGQRTPAMVAQSYQIGNTIIGGGLALGACIVACPAAGVAALIGGAGGAVGGGIVGYQTTGTAQGTALGAIAGGLVGVSAATANPILATGVSNALGGGTIGIGAGAVTATIGNAVAGAAGTAAATTVNGQLPSAGQLELGAAVGAASGILEAPFSAANGIGAGGEAALSAQTQIFNTIGNIAIPSAPK